MSVRTFTFACKAAAVAGLLSATGIVAALPASASSLVELTGFYGTEEFNCSSTTHGIDIQPLYTADNQCGVRLWLHQDQNGGGWAYCINPHSDVSVPTKYDLAAQAYVSTNTANC